MKHVMAVAELNGWVLAISEAITRNVISNEAGTFLAERSAEHARNLLEGNVVNGKRLIDHAEDGETFEEVLNDVFNSQSSSDTESRGYNE